MFQANPTRYQEMRYRSFGNSGLKVSALALGLWHNFGSVDARDKQAAVLHQALDLGITYFDLANNYGPTPGSAEENFGWFLQHDLKPYRDQMVIASKAGYPMWPGPYGDGGSRKSILASADQSLTRLGLDYVDIFYSHRRDPETPLEETARALDQLVRSGKALYVGISNYNPADAAQMAALFQDLGTPYLGCQSRYNLFNRQPEDGLLDTLAAAGKGMVAYSPLAQGLLTGRYRGRVPADSRAARSSSRFLGRPQVAQTHQTVAELSALAEGHGTNLAALSLAWILRQPAVASVIVGASRPQQLVQNVQALRLPPLDDELLGAIDQILSHQAPIDWDAR